MTDAARPLVGIVMGSQSDHPVMQRCAEVLESYGIPHEVAIRSAHRDPQGCRDWAVQAADRGNRVIIAAAGGAAHLPGVVAAWTILPVIGVPMSGGSLGGLDALLSIAQMPAGIPVATVAIGDAGARNAAHLAAAILALTDPQMVDRIRRARETMRAPQEKRPATPA